MSAPTFAEAVQATAERLRDPVQHVRDLDLWVGNMDASAAARLRTALVPLLDLALPPAFRDPIAHALASISGQGSFYVLGCTEDHALGFVRGLLVAQCIDQSQSSRLDALIRNAADAARPFTHSDD